MGKRPDQHNIDPSEAGATDYKDLPQTGRGNAGNLDTPQRDKQQLARSRKDEKGQPFLPDVPAPSAHTRHGKRISEDEESAGDAADEKEGES